MIEQAKAIYEELLEIRRTIHANPEVGEHLPNTTAFVCEILKSYGYEPEELCDSGIVATIGKEGGKTILLRADMDALPIREATACAFRSENGAMHACGHDMHTTMLLGAAKLLKENQDELEGMVKLVFQPNEEGLGGARTMIEAGVLEHPKVDAGFSMHVSSGTPTGMVLGGLGVCMTGCTNYRILIKGTGCHGAMPETGVDPINIAAHIYLSLQEILAREISAEDTVVATIGKLQAGDAPNIIPDQAVLEGTIRYRDRELGEKVYQRICEIAVSTAQMFRGSAELEILASVPPLKNDVEMVEEMLQYIRAWKNTNEVVTFEGGGMASEDFAAYTYEIPCTYLMVGAGTKEENVKFGKPMHNPSVVFNEELLVTGAAMYADCAIQWLKHHK